jgi:ABC-type antimicrobial peptide transport system permease subunit
VGIPAAYLLNMMQEAAMQQVMGIRFALNAGQIIYTLSLLVVAATVAAYLPARNAARTDVLEALHYE